MTNPLVSVIVPSYNHSKYIQECLESIISQSYHEIELIVIDDGSTDGSVAIVEGMVARCVSRFTRFEFRARENRGLLPTLNEGLEWASGSYLCAVASDDVWLKEKTALQVTELARDSEVAAVFGGMALIDGEGKHLRTIRRKGSHSFGDIFFHRHFLPTPTAMMRLELVRAIGYDENIKIEDWYMWLQLAQYGRLETLDDVLALYRQHGTNMSGNGSFMYEEGMKILARFSSHVDYKRAVSEYELAMAALLAPSNKRQAWAHFIRHARSFCLSMRSFVVLVKLMCPGYVLAWFNR